MKNKTRVSEFVMTEAAKKMDARKKILEDFGSRYPETLVADCGRFIVEGPAGHVQVCRFLSTDDSESVEVGGIFVPHSKVRILLRSDVAELSRIDAELEKIRTKRKNLLKSAHRRAAAQPADLAQLKRIHAQRRELEAAI